MFPTYLLTDLRHVTVGQHVKIGLQTRVMDGFPIPLCFERPTETYILTNGGILLGNSVHQALSN